MGQQVGGPKTLLPCSTTGSCDRLWTGRFLVRIQAGQHRGTVCAAADLFESWSLMKLWVDDLRKPPDQTWVWCRSSAEAIDILHRVGSGVVTQMSLDHDLGGDDTTRPIVLWLCESLAYWPAIITVHSANPVGREWLEAMISRYRPR